MRTTAKVQINAFPNCQDKSHRANIKDIVSKIDTLLAFV